MREVVHAAARLYVATLSGGVRGPARRDRHHFADSLYRQKPELGGPTSKLKLRIFTVFRDALSVTKLTLERLEQWADRQFARVGIPFTAAERQARLAKLRKLAAKTLRAPGTRNNEWYTPAEHIEAVRAAMGGIDLDPASCELAQEVVKAGRFFSVENDGLEQEWSGRVFSESAL